MAEMPCFTVFTSKPVVEVRNASEDGRADAKWRFG